MQFILITIFSAFTAFGNIPERQDQVFDNKISDNKIKSVLLYKEGWNLSNPVLKLGSNDKLVLGFDLLSDKVESYDYTFIHCDKDWKMSDIFVSDYLSGFQENYIEDFKPSFNTTVHYTHYSLRFPNDRVTLTISGNYIISVYPEGHPDKPVITQRFVVSEDIAGIEISGHRPQLTTGDNASQQIDFTVSLGSLFVADPARDIYSFILQNGRWNNAKKNLRPDMAGSNILKYNSLSSKNIFSGGNEFRYFDIRSIKYLSENVRRISFMPPYYNVYLNPSENREFKPYFYNKDFNGKYYIATKEGENPETDADYINVYFTLPSKYLLSGGNMYVSGSLSNWSFNPENMMIYNPQAEQYECTMLLKQGWYNYEYVFLRDGDTEGVATKFEGSHYETENDYMVLVYYRSPNERYDRLIGTGAFNTLNNLSY